MGVSRAISRAPFVCVPPASQALGGEREREIAERAGELAGRRPLLKDEVCPTLSGSRPGGDRRDSELPPVPRSGCRRGLGCRRLAAGGRPSRPAGPVTLSDAVLWQPCCLKLGTTRSGRCGHGASRSLAIPASESASSRPAGGPGRVPTSESVLPCCLNFEVSVTRGGPGRGRRHGVSRSPPGAHSVTGCAPAVPA
jgi:hypothetical protein